MYIVSDKRMYRLSADRTGRPHIDREMSYRNSGIPKPSQVDAGSGTTPMIPPGGLVAITDNANPMDAVVYRTATRLRHHQHRVVCQVPVFAKSASASENSLIGSGHSLSVENNYGYQDPFAPDTGAITRLRLRAGGHQQARQQLRAGVDKPHRERPQRGYQSSPRQPRLDRAIGASASGADQPRHRRRDASQAWPLPDKGSHANAVGGQMPAPARRQGSRRAIQETPYSPTGGPSEALVRSAWLRARAAKQASSPGRRDRCNAAEAATAGVLGVS